MLTNYAPTQATAAPAPAPAPAPGAAPNAVAAPVLNAAVPVAEPYDFFSEDTRAKINVNIEAASDQLRTHNQIKLRLYAMFSGFFLLVSALMASVVLAIMQQNKFNNEIIEDEKSLNNTLSLPLPTKILAYNMDKYCDAFIDGNTSLIKACDAIQDDKISWVEWEICLEYYVAFVSSLVIALFLTG